MIRDFISKIFQATLLKWGYGFEPQADHEAIMYRAVLIKQLIKNLLLFYPLK